MCSKRGREKGLGGSGDDAGGLTKRVATNGEKQTVDKRRGSRSRKRRVVQREHRAWLLRAKKSKEGGEGKRGGTPTRPSVEVSTDYKPEVVRGSMRRGRCQRQNETRDLGTDRPVSKL